MEKRLEKQMLADGVRMARARYRWTQEELAARSNLTKPTIVRIEAERPVKFESMSRIAAAFDMTIAELMTFGSQGKPLDHAVES